MGWTGYPNDRRKAIDIVKEELTGEFHKAVANSGSRYWVIENTKTGVRFGVVVLCNRRDGMLFTKVMDESMGPCYYRFPERFLGLLSDTDNKYALEWRQKVREYHASKKATPKLDKGDTVVFGEALDFTNGYSLDRMVYLGGYRFRGILSGGYTTTVRLPRNWRTRYEWKVEKNVA